MNLTPVKAKIAKQKKGFLQNSFDPPRTVTMINFRFFIRSYTIFENILCH